jgi:hypothetical protein
MSRSYQNKLNSFCYICGEMVLKSQRNALSKLVRKAYELYFGCKIGDEGKFGGAEHLLRLLFKDGDG